MNKLIKEISKTKKQFNPDFMDGIAQLMVPKAPEFLDAIIKNNIKRLPENIGLEYHGWRRLSPNEEYISQFNSSVRKDGVDIAKNTLYKVEYLFTYKGEEIRREILLPYVERGGIMKLSGTTYAIVPVLTEYVISATLSEVFIRLMKDKIITKRVDKNVLVIKEEDDMIKAEKKPYPILVGKFYKFIISDKHKINDKVPAVLLFMSKYGFNPYFEKFFGFKPKVVKDLTLEQKQKYVEEGNIIVTTTGHKPRELDDPSYEPHTIAFIVPKDKATKPVMEVLTALIYTFDLLNRFSMKNLLNAIDSENEIQFWRTVLGKVIFKNNFSESKILTLMNEYLNILDSYIDGFIKEKLHENKIMVEDYFELLQYVLENFEKLTLSAVERTADIKNRYVDILYYILYPLIEGINRTFPAINREYNKKRDLTKKDIEKIFNKNFSTKKFYTVVKSSKMNIAVLPVDSSTDNYIPKITSILECQNRGQGVVRNSKQSFPAPTRILHAWDLAFGSLLHIGKKNPSPRFRTNAFVGIDRDTARFKIREDLIPILENLETMLQGKFEDETILEKELGVESGGED